MQAIWSWLGENKFFREVTVAWTEAYMDRVVCMMPFTGFSTSSKWTLLTLSEHSKLQPAWCALPLLLYSTQQLRAFPFHNEDIIMDGQTASGAASLLCSCRRCFIWSSVTAWQIWLPRKLTEAGGDRMRIICHFGQVQWRWLFSSNLHCDCWASFLLTLSLFRSAAGCIQDYVESSMIIGFATIIAETITLMCLS